MARNGKRVSAREFSRRFTKIVSRHLSPLPPEEQDKRIKAAEQTALQASRASRPTTRRAEETRAIHLLSRSRE
jgi:hypothetical protein